VDYAEVVTFNGTPGIPAGCKSFSYLGIKFNRHIELFYFVLPEYRMPQT
jgi:hypothetical protein